MSDHKPSDLQPADLSQTSLSATDETLIVTPSLRQTASQQEGMAQTGSFHSTLEHTQQTRTADLQQDPDKILVGTLELREEVPEVQILREKLGAISVRRERRVREETITVDLVTEVLVIETTAGTPSVTLLGVELPVGEALELEIYREDAEISKKVVRSEHIKVFKDRVTETISIPTVLAREELVVDEHPAAETTLPDQTHRDNS
ncbi:DUF2382 domain-containing protein [Deinococcus roseus]|uniref:DUF2382 domain-containing protein n=1 Tax=Deinococcus roseus TaxID=392414 RepID=A0ABQ2CXZ3_9DEIO|nr:DUF2382 domain-containing protein [Deinococcus roseus]GGJ27746.1 hypothetical protein GCM10008938_12260 [Deinococcus roseus]